MRCCLLRLIMAPLSDELPQFRTRMSWSDMMILLELMLVGHAVDEGHDDVETRHQDAVELAQPLDNPGVLLGHDLEGLDGKDDG